MTKQPMQTVLVQGYGLMYIYQVKQQIKRLNNALASNPLWENGWWLRQLFIDTLKNNSIK